MDPKSGKLGSYNFCFFVIYYDGLGILILMMLLCSGFFEQVSWSTCSEGEGTKTGSGNFDYKVTYLAYIC